MSGCDGTGNGGLLVLVVYALTGEEGGATLRSVEDDGALLVAGSLEGCDDSRARSDVDGGDGIAVLLCVLEQPQDIVTGDDTFLARENAGSSQCLIPTHALCRLVEQWKTPMLPPPFHLVLNRDCLLTPQPGMETRGTTYSLAPIVIVVVACR